MCNGNKVPLFTGVFPLPLVSPYYRITTEQVKGTHLVVVRIGSTGPRERGLPKTYFHNDFPGSVGLDNASAHIAKALRAILTLNFYLSERSIPVKSGSSLSSLYSFTYLFPLLTTSGIHELNNFYHTFRWSISTGQSPFLKGNLKTVTSRLTLSLGGVASASSSHNRDTGCGRRLC